MPVTCWRSPEAAPVSRAQPLLPDLLDLLSALLQYDPAERITARAALRHAFFAGEAPARSNGALSADAEA